jgi:trimeric autotransporter adhesin
MFLKSVFKFGFVIAGTVSGVMAQNSRPLAIEQPLQLELRNTSNSDRSIAAKELTQIVRVEGAPWLRLHVGTYKLAAVDYITIRSLRDKGTQQLDAKSLQAWRLNTAFFNGDAVSITLHVEKAGTDSYISFRSVTAGLAAVPSFDPGSQNTICGPNDDRTAIVDAPIGRINRLNAGTNTSNPFCTGWAVSNGAFLTAGHCVDADPDEDGPLLPDGAPDAVFLNGVIEFNVPLSQPNGTTVFSDPSNQYPINQVNFQYPGSSATTSSLGRDWAVFSVSPNSTHTYFPPQPFRGYYRMTDQTPVANSENVRVSGYGIDNTPPGTTGGENAQTRTLQSHTSTYLGQTQENGGTFHSYSVDTTAANSGSPIVWSGNPLFTIGIHTTGGCTSTGGSNSGTSFGHDALETALQNFWGPNTVYVDTAVYPNTSAAQRNGTIFRPHATLVNGIIATPTGGNLVLMPNTYTGVPVFNRAMTIRAPAGAVTVFP